MSLHQHSHSYYPPEHSWVRWVRASWRRSWRYAGTGQVETGRASHSHHQQQCSTIRRELGAAGLDYTAHCTISPSHTQNKFQIKNNYKIIVQTVKSDKTQVSEKYHSQGWRGSHQIFNPTRKFYLQSSTIFHFIN